MVYDVISIRHRYVGEHPHAECDYEPHDALGVIARLLRQFSADEAVQQVNELMEELGSLMYGQPTATTPSASGGNVVLTRDALEMLLEDTVNQAVDRRLRSELDRAGLRLPEGIVPPTPVMVPALPLPTVPLVGPSSEADVAPMSVPASAVGDVALVGAENVRLAGDAINRGNAYLEQGEYDRAVAEYTVAIGLNPQDADACYKRGVAYSRQGEYERAIADYTTAIRLNPKFVQAYMRRGFAYGEQGDHGRAVAGLYCRHRAEPAIC